MQSGLKIDKVDPAELAVAILGWLANEPDMLSRFLALSGLGPHDLRPAMADPGFHAGLLDFIMQHEPTLVAFAAASGYTPEQIADAWHRISGPGLDSGQY
ncbi:DUF3572 domain-containing protein [Gellertiella hungarica]|uniref:DUF3572 domain-containing protein n=1 Tax=Gellertiella hungarica TaxID=1572859 RepID=A0A7W6J8F8_9HYPH|nr:DUF3572 domain-containing protein [Gellertiella hungarica]MBB4066704.1 hypothetical protein [Gellertiella hungarica]